MASDPIPEEELPPRLRFERIVEGPEPEVFRSVRPDPDLVPADEASPDPAGESESDASILERFESLKRTLGSEIEPASPAPIGRPSSEEPPRPAHSEGSQSSETGDSLDQLQARVREVRRQERQTRDRTEELPGLEQSEASGPGLTYDELEQLKQVESVEQKRETRKEKRRRRRKNRSFWQELPILILVALVVAIVIKTFFFQAFYIPSGSMIPALEVNDRVLVNKLSYRFGAIERGDILVFDSPEAVEVERSFFERVFRSIGEATGLTSPDTVLIKRVIGLPGETVEVRNNQVYVNGNPIAEPYLPDGVSMRDEPEITIPADFVFMMGDNRNASNDSRRFGPIPREHIVGRAFVSVWPPGAWGGL